MQKEDWRSMGERRQASLPTLLEELDRCKASGDPSGTGWAFAKIGTLHQTQGKNREALSYFEESLKVFEELGDRAGEASVSALMGHLLAQQGAWDRSLEALDRARRIQEELADRAGLAATGGSVGGDDVSGITEDEKIAWLGVGNHIRIDARIRARDKQGLRLLAHRQPLEQLAL